MPFNFSQDFDWILAYTNVNDKNKVIGRTVERKYYETDDYDFLNISKPYARKFKKDDDLSGKLSAVISDFQIQDFLKTVLSEAKNMDGNSQIDEIFGRDEFDYAKPENLIKAILEVSTGDDDLILDFFLGSGTTCAVAHKMNRRYIGVDQMDYIERLAVTRLKKVIEGEQGGVSEKVDWQGGGSFVYCELAIYSFDGGERFEPDYVLFLHSPDMQRL